MEEHTVYLMDDFYTYTSKEACILHSLHNVSHTLRRRSYLGWLEYITQTFLIFNKVIGKSILFI